MVFLETLNVNSLFIMQIEHDGNALVYQTKEVVQLNNLALFS